MIDEHFQDHPPDQKLVRLVRRFSVLEGRQPRAMVSHSRDCESTNKIRKLSVELAGFGFDVDIGTPFESYEKVGMNAIENDADLLILMGGESGPKREFTSDLKKFLSGKGYSDLFILSQSGLTDSDDLVKILITWLRETLS